MAIKSIKKTVVPQTGAACSPAIDLNCADENGSASREFRVLFCTWSELDITSGTPVIVCDLLRHFPPGCAEVVTEANVDHKQHRRVLDIEHPIHKYKLHAWLWPFARGSRLRSRIAWMGLPALVAQLVLRVIRFKPDCIFTVYSQPHWVFATWITSRLTGIPLVYHVHDAFLELNDLRHRSEFSRWLERKTMTTQRILALDDHMAEHYESRYGIECTILRHVVRHSPLPAKSVGFMDGHANELTSGTPIASRPITIGFAGAIYDSNSRQLAELCRLVREDPTLSLKIWTGSTAAALEPLGIGGLRS